MSDEGQWFDRGLRVELVQSWPASHELEKAVLGSYEVLGCARVADDSGRWLDVRLRRTFQLARTRRHH